MSQILQANDVDISKITFSTVKTNKYGGKLCYLNYNRGPLRIQTPKMSLPFGISKWENAPGSNSYKYKMDFSFSDFQSDPKMQKFYEIMKAVEEKVKSEAEAQSVSWFKKKQSKEIINEFFKSQIKHSTDETGEITDKYPPRISTKIVYSEQDGFRVDIYDSVKNEEGELDRLELSDSNTEEVVPKGSKAVAILECTGIWFADKSFGISWKVAQAKVFRNQSKLIGNMLNDAGDEDEEQTVESSQNEEEYKPSEIVEQEQTQEETQHEETEQADEDVKVVNIEVPKKKSVKKKV